jgi:hypothetical protein
VYSFIFQANVFFLITKDTVLMIIFQFLFAFVYFFFPRKTRDGKEQRTSSKRVWPNPCDKSKFSPLFSKRKWKYFYTFNHNYRGKSSNRANSTNHPVWHLICRNKPAINPKWFNSSDTNSTQIFSNKYLLKKTLLD